MFEQILIANRGDQPTPGGAAAQPHGPVAPGHQGDLAPETRYV
jgi:hypothetical protein